MTQYTVHNKLTQQVMRPQTAKSGKAGTKSTQPGYIAYICMFITLFNYIRHSEYNFEQKKQSPYQLIEIMKYTEFERIISQKRLRRYVTACGGNTRKAMTLYRYNIQLSEVMFAIICHFEVALRNAIDNHLTPKLGNDWIKNSVMTDGVFTHPVLFKTREIITHAYNKLQRNGSYSHTKLLAEMEFGIWKYMFSPVQYRQTGRTLLQIFPNREHSSATKQYNHSFIFNELDRINTLRNRIAHHEPICFPINEARIYTDYILNEYNKIMMLFKWMGINGSELLFGIDHVSILCTKINKLNLHKNKTHQLDKCQGLMGFNDANISIDKIPAK